MEDFKARLARLTNRFRNFFSNNTATPSSCPSPITLREVSGESLVEAVFDPTKNKLFKEVLFQL